MKKLKKRIGYVDREEGRKDRRYEEGRKKKLDEQKEAGGEETGEGGDDLRAACCNLPHTPVGFTY